MPVEVSLNTPLAEALNAAILPKLVEVGWGSGGSDDSTLAEYVILMLVNGKSQDQIAAELSNDLLSLPPDDPTAGQFCAWLFDQIDALNAQLHGGQAAGDDGNAMDNSEMDTDMGSNDVAELNAYVIRRNSLKPYSHHLVPQVRAPCAMETTEVPVTSACSATCRKPWTEPATSFTESEAAVARGSTPMVATPPLAPAAACAAVACTTTTARLASRPASPAWPLVTLRWAAG
jgi:hypothetical protein